MALGKPLHTSEPPYPPEPGPRRAHPHRGLPGKMRERTPEPWHRVLQKPSREERNELLGQVGMGRDECAQTARASHQHSLGPVGTPASPHCTYGPPPHPPTPLQGAEPRPRVMPAPRCPPVPLAQAASRTPQPPAAPSQMLQAPAPGGGQPATPPVRLAPPPQPRCPPLHRGMSWDPEGPSRASRRREESQPLPIPTRHPLAWVPRAAQSPQVPASGCEQASAHTGDTLGQPGTQRAQRQ